LTLNGRFVRARYLAIVSRARSAPAAPTAIPPKPPASLTADAIAGVDVPAIGA